VAERIGTFFGLIERVRYAPSASTPAEREEALRLAQQLIEQLDRDRTLAARGLAGLVLAVCTATALAQGSFNPQAAFFEGNAAYSTGRYAEAAAAYQSVHDAGFAGGALYFNLGNAHFKDGRLGEAILSSERALRIRPRDADVRANLAYARERAKDEPADEPLWQRAVTPLAERATSGELAAAVAVLWWVLWLALIARFLWPRASVASTRAAFAAGAVLLLVTPSFGSRLAQVDLVRPGVVTASGETPVRFEPTETGTQYFTVNEGVSIEVTEERDAWLQIRRSDGRRGWIPRSAVTEL
jgi:tetratricopeptide (TPR) repeat protein